MKAKKIFMSLIYAAMALSMALPVHAEQNVGDQARGLATQCPHCFGTVDIWDSKESTGEDHVFCTHASPGGANIGMGPGYDIYTIYETVRHESCRDCSYRKTTNLGDKTRVLAFCPRGN